MAGLCCNPHKEGTQWLSAADEPHSTCQPGQGGGDVLLLSQQLGWMNSPWMSWAHDKLTVILTHPSIQCYLPQGLTTPHWAPALWFIDCV